MMWVRWTLPRLRIDQVMMTCLKYLLPISCVLLLGVSVWQAAGAADRRCCSITEVSCWPAACVAGCVVLHGAVKLTTSAATLPIAGVTHRCGQPAPPNRRRKLHRP